MLDPAKALGLFDRVREWLLKRRPNSRLVEMASLLTLKRREDLLNKLIKEEIRHTEAMNRIEEEKARIN
jgi:hypothetical protein